MIPTNMFFTYGAHLICSVDDITIDCEIQYGTRHMNTRNVIYDPFDFNSIYGDIHVRSFRKCFIIINIMALENHLEKKTV